MKELPEKEVLAQLEEAYARATVALTRAQKLCIIMGPLDMRGLLGAATVIGCLKYGAGVCGVHVSNPAAEVFLKDGSDWVTHSELPKVATILFRLCRTARQPFSSELRTTWLWSQSTAEPMSVAACI